MFVVGNTVRWKGTFTKLSSLNVGLRNGRNSALEDALGFHRGRLDEGFALLLLVEKPTPYSVRIQGMTNESGGREGPPGRTVAEDEARPFVDDAYREEREKRWRSFPNMLPEVRKNGLEWAHHDVACQAVDILKFAGPERAAKIVPVIRHDEDMSPADQYPVGGGVVQLKLEAEIDWLVAAKVRADGSWETLPGWPPLTQALLTDHRAEQAKSRMMKLLEEAQPLGQGQSPLTRPSKWRMRLEELKRHMRR